MRHFQLYSLVLLGAMHMTGSTTAWAVPPKLPHAPPEEAGLSSEKLAVIDDLVAEGLKENRMPGAVVAVGRQGKIVFLKAYGHKQLQPEKVEMTTDTLFDMASITKPVATASSIMLLMQDGKLHPRDLVADYIPEFANNGKEQITIYQLLTHQGGLIPDNALRDYQDGPDKAMERVYALGLRAEPGTQFIYTDVGFIVLAEIVKRVSGLNVHEFSQQRIFQPLGMTETGYLPDESLQARAATTQQRQGRWMRGEVHDPRAYLMEGVAGHAGLFSTAEDLAVYAQMMLSGGTYGNVEVMKPETVALMTRSYTVPRGLRGLGWDALSGYSSNRGENFSSRAFGHGGFTGTTFWVDPELDLFVIFLSNRVHPDGKGLVNPLAGRIGTAAAAAIQTTPVVSEHRRPRRRSDDDAKPVLAGIDVLQRDGFRPLAGRRVGLITNHTGLNRAGVSTVQLLHDAADVELVKLFSPEHGFEGKLDVSNIGDSRDTATGLKVFSLYGQTRKPTAESLSDIDTIVFDIQDIGARFYTYMSTMGYAMQAAAEHNVRFVVLDRPNPIGAVEVSGPVLDAGSESFVGFHPIPVRHGMTIGELARMFNAELNLGLDLHVVQVEGWERSDLYDATGLMWVNPSPNMRNLNQALLYPGIGLLETTNLSVGRGTDTPFEVIGAPWIDGMQLAAALNRLNLPGVRFVPIAFTPESSKFQNERCGGIHILITNRDEFRSVRTGLEIARQLRRLYPDGWDPKSYNRLLSNRRTLEAVLAGKTVDEIELIYQPELETFRQRRAGFLLY
jgi:uncharacterized protein YbbC (DUF1343 family)/CubicO group peptidase (beta-lactamase class C family)